MAESGTQVQPKKHPKGCFFALWAMALLWILLILAASWAPDSRMTELRWIPGWAAAWADRDPNIRTAVPFIPLAFLLVHGFAMCNLKWPVVWSVAGSAACLGLAERGQVFLPARTADVADLLWGAAGILIGAGVARGTRMRGVEQVNVER